MNVYEAYSIIVPEGRVKRILDMNDTVLWKKRDICLTPFYLEDLSGEENTITVRRTVESGSSNYYFVSIDKSYDGTNWETVGEVSGGGVSILIPANRRVYLRATPNYVGHGVWFHRKSGSIGDIYNHFTGSKRYKVGGNITSLDKFITFNGEVPKLYPFGKLFYNDGNLVDASELVISFDNTQLTSSCCYQMFSGCTSLVNAPKLQAITLSDYCYNWMFYNCSSLSSLICNATDISASSCTQGWLSGVSSTGIFYKNANMKDWTSGVSGIPNNWTIQDIA